MKRFVLLVLFLALPGAASLRAAELPVVRVNIIVLTEYPEALAAINAKSTGWIVNVLNRKFKSLEGRQLATFVLGRVFPLAETKNLEPALFSIADDRGKWQALLKKGLDNNTDLEVLDKGAFNIAIYHDPKANALSTGGYKYRVMRRWGVTYSFYYPRALLHWRVLKKKYGGIVLHEAGHAFGLGHVRPELPGSRFASNVMRSKKNGTVLPDAVRGYYFTQSQTRIIQEKLQLYRKTVELRGRQ